MKGHNPKRVRSGNTSLHRLPESLSNYSLASLLPSLGSTTRTQNGCVWPTGNPSAESVCQEFVAWPQNGEYKYYSDSSETCYPCVNQQGCDSALMPGPGAECSQGQLCTTSLYEGQRCGVQRVAFNGSPAACCMLSKSSVSTNGITGWNKNSNDNWGNWNFIGMGSGRDDIFTCELDIDCSTAASAVANACGQFSRPLTFTAWQIGEPTPPNNGSGGTPTGYCYNYANNIDTSSASTVLNAALTSIQSTPNFDIATFGLNNEPQAQALNNIIGLCSTKGNCDATLTNICKPKKYNDVLTAYKNYLDPNSSPLEKIVNQNVYQACGCHLQSSEYEQWANLGVSVPCDPICMIPGTASLWSTNGPVQCEQNLCIIDDVKIDIINSNAGNITFNQVCGGCGESGGCRCIFSGLNIFESGSSVGNVNFTQNCGNCQIPDPNNPGNFIPINCATGLPSGGGGGTVLTTWDLVKKWMSAHRFELLVTIIFIIIALFVLFIWLNKKPTISQRGNLASEITLADMFKNYGIDL